MTIAVCLGSSCHVKGSKDIVEMLKVAVRTHGLEKKVKLSGSVCFGMCAADGANVKVDDEIITGITKENFNDFFKEKVLAKLA